MQDFESERKWKLAQARRVALRASKGIDQCTWGEKKLKVRPFLNLEIGFLLIPSCYLFLIASYQDFHLSFVKYGQEEEHRLRKVALNISKDVKKFWIKIEKLVSEILDVPPFI